MTKRSSQRPVLTLRELNRAMLARQLLLERARIGVVRAVERLAALQAQWAPSPYIALWSRLVDFRREKLWTAIERHEVIRARLMRGTLHLVSAHDFYAYAVATQDLQRVAWNRLQVGRGVDPAEVAALAIAFARQPRPKEEVLAHIQERMGKSLGGPFKWLVWRFVSAHADLVTAPPGGHWEYGGTDAPYVAARHWIAHGKRPAEGDALETLVLRCLAAFGPVTVADVAKFAGQVPPRVRPTLERMAPKLRTFSDEEGRLLYDLPRAPRPDGDVAAPVRFLPRYDELLISYQHRDRVIAPAHRRSVYTKNAIVEAVVMVDGFAAGTWSVGRAKNEAVLRISSFARIAPRDRASVETEGRALLSFLAPDASTLGVRFA
ncbi:MAG TPA: winged helix DNA-binding domain-containing protein [Candidatus Polarisedimenticolia bacterium]|nr:winged helix DNA-binding domain-containing protein [Candidatus Polarisedimenticolia bacterium]